MIVCPFHADKNPSMKLNEDYYYCFGCGATGDAIDFVAQLFGIGTREAAEKIAADFGLQYDSKAPRPLPRKTAAKAQIAKHRELYTSRVLSKYFRLRRSRSIQHESHDMKSVVAGYKREWHAESIILYK